MSEQKDLSHLVLAVCPTIENDILNLTVSPEGISTYEWTNPDPTTGCIGMKFDFGPDLNKVNGTFTFSFELATPLPVGPVGVCVKGGQQSLSNLTICGPICETTESCDKTVYQEVDICAPVTIAPIVTTQSPTIVCCGDPTFDCDPLQFPHDVCTFSIQQKICVGVPLSFSADVLVNDVKVGCGTPSEEFCPNCNGNETL